MEYILKNISFQLIIQETASLSISILFGFFIWMIKRSYDKYCEEVYSLKKIEICLSGDFASNTHNEKFLNDWIDSLQNNRLFSCSFRNYFLDNSEFVHLTNTTLINKLNALSFGLNVLSHDLENIFGRYYSNSIKFLDGDHIKEWYEMNTNTKNQLMVFRTNFSEAETDIKGAVTYLRAYYKQKSFSIFRLFSSFSVNIYPTLTEKDIQIELIALNKNIENKKNASTQQFPL
jgi:hypothetical protein